MKKQRKHYSPGREGCQPKEASAGAGADLGAVCQTGTPAHGFYRWQKEFFESGAAVSGRFRVRDEVDYFRMAD